MKSVLAAYWPSVRKYLVLFWIGTIFMMAIVGLKALQPFLLRQLWNTFTVQEWSRAETYNVFWQIVAFFLLLNVTWTVFDWFIVKFEAGVMRDLDMRSFAAIQSQSIRFFENAFSGSLVKRATRLRNAFEPIADAYFFHLGRGAVFILATLVIFFLEYPMVAVSFGAWVLLFLGVSVLAARIQFPLSAAEAEADSNIGAQFADSFANESTVKAYGQERQEQRCFDAVVDAAFRTRLRAWTMSIFLNRLRGLTLALFEVLLVWFLIQGWQEGTVAAGDFVFFQTYVLLLMHQLWEVSNVIHRLFQRFAEGKEMADMFSLKPEVQDAPGARSLIVHDGAIEFHAARFSYLDRGGDEDDDVNDFSLRIQPGKSIALVGPSGAGKTTLVKLLQRSFDLQGGYIRIDGQDIADVTQESLRQQIAVVPQQPDLFHRSLRDNIRFARPDALEQEIIDAAKRAHAWEFIERLPHGLDTLVGERGIKLSGGERQRIALARAFLAEAPILVLDEATSALDSRTEKYIQSAIADLLRGRTSIVIAHRLSTIMRADHIIVMKRGAMVEQGTHAQLLQRNDVYADLWKHQVGGYIN